METVMIITLLIIAVASVALNTYQYMERRVERKETNRLIAQGARLEDKYNELEKTYNNEVLHKNWAIGRIKDQQAVIDRLSSVQSYNTRRTKNKQS